MASSNVNVNLSLVRALDPSNDRRRFSHFFICPSTLGVSRLNEDSLNLGLYISRKRNKSSLSYLQVTIECNCFDLLSNVNRIVSSDSSDSLTSRNSPNSLSARLEVMHAYDANSALSNYNWNRNRHAPSSSFCPRFQG